MAEVPSKRGSSSAVDPPSPSDAHIYPDVMTDPQYKPEPKFLAKGLEDLDSCRICRGESTPEEPLFYPCKCSGSIKFVHQECLMEWLSHSQKKHCELCKTPFRFTKLYSPDMPKQVPTPLFLQKAAVHLVRALLSWFRAALVMSIWTIWLPWSMRFVWWGLFWIGDGGWARNIEALKQGLDAEQALQNLTRSGMSNETALSRARSMPRLLQLPFAKDMLSLFGVLNETTMHTGSAANTTSHNATDLDLTVSHASLLSDLSIFRQLTPNPSVNKFIVDTAEGQVITLCVVTGFILVFLIREWVVQQGPALNLGQLNDRGNEAVENDGPAPLAVPENQNQPERTENTDPFDPTEEDVEFSIVSLSECQDTLDFLSQDSFADWQGDIAELERVKELIGSVRREFFTLKNRARTALDCDDVLEAQSVIARLHRLQDFLTSQPWKNYWELEGIMKIAQESVKRSLSFHLDWKLLTDLRMLELEEGAGDLHYKVADVAVPEDTTGLEPLLDPSQLTSTSYDGNDSAPKEASSSALRPEMPARIESSIATEIHRELEEADEAKRPPAPGLLPTNDHTILDNSDHESDDAWTFASVADEDGPEKSTDNIDGSSSSQPPLRRKHRAEALSAEYLGVHSDVTADHDLASLGANDKPSIVLDSDDHLRRASAATPEPPSALHNAAANASDSSSTDSPRNQDLDNSQPENPDSIPTSDDAENAVAERTISERLLDWIFGDNVPTTPESSHAGNDERIVEDPAAEAPFVPFHQGHMHHPQNQAGQDDQQGGEQGEGGDLAAQQAANVANDAEAVEDAEDLDGILELIGMQGPLAGLFQNAVFAAVLVSATVTSAILFPYMCGKLVFLTLANPASAINLPVQVIASMTNFIIDFLIFSACSILAAIDWAINNLLRPLIWISPALAAVVEVRRTGKFLRGMADSALLRIAESMFVSGSESDKLPVTLDSLVALRALQGQVRNLIDAAEISCEEVSQYISGISTFSAAGLIHESSRAMYAAQAYILTDFKQTTFLLANILKTLKTGKLVISVSNPTSTLPSDLSEFQWTINDRLIAILTGYVLLAVAGMLYIRRRSPFATSEQGRKVEGIIRDLFEQSAGVFKVILIIGIEMLVFPLYCGFLLDVAMLPLFQSSSITSRISFTLSSPYTSAFFHWFIGTCYMFHFALFVSMCRKIFRKGVLYFIRDPDDPNFHPIRDVLERSISSQLRKIGFSAIVYGGLVILCMGSVVWTVAYGVSGVFPIRWTLKDSYLGYPVDLLLYNLLAPFAVHFLRPSKGLHKVYEWWFRKSARLLRLSHFLFNENDEDESGTANTASGVDRYGTFVRVPASDSVRIPRGTKVFLEVDENDDRLDGEAEPEGVWDSHGRRNSAFSKVWIPPLFRARIGCFLFFMWALTAALGLLTTVAPLLIGRVVIALVYSGTVPANDLYAYFIGICPLIAAFYSRTAVAKAWAHLQRQNWPSLQAASSDMFKVSSQIVRTLYAYGALLLFVPTLLALLLECYFILPLQSYNNIQSRSTAPHTMHLLQDWTLGVMYLRILFRLALWNAESRPARGLKAIVAKGWLDPDIKIATRCFLLPITAASLLALAVPSGIAYSLGRTLPVLATSGALVERFPRLASDNVAVLQVQMVRFSYPLALWLATVVWSLYIMGKAAGRWRMRIRDEIYLIGERLHNFGERRPGPGGAVVRQDAVSA